MKPHVSPAFPVFGYLATVALAVACHVASGPPDPPDPSPAPPPSSSSPSPSSQPPSGDADAGICCDNVCPASAQQACTDSCYSDCVDLSEDAGRDAAACSVPLCWNLCLRQSGCYIWCQGSCFSFR